MRLLVRPIARDNSITMSKEDHLSNEVVISAKLEERGLVAAVRSRALAAFDRLLGSAADLPAAHLENIAAKARLRGEIERRKLVEASQRPDREDIEEGRRYLEAKSAEEQATKIENLSKIVEASVETLSEEVVVASEEEEVDPDWLNRFRLYAAEVSTETMQRLWGRVLAGEIRKPHTFSLATLRFLSEVDEKVARTFQATARLVLGGDFVPKPKRLSGNALAEYGLLEEADLLRDVNGFIGIDREPTSEGKIYLREGKLLLIADTSSKQRLDLIPLTRVGKELLSILPRPDPFAGLEAAFCSMDSDRITAARIALILEDLPSGQLRYSDLKILKPES